MRQLTIDNSGKWHFPCRDVACHVRRPDGGWEMEGSWGGHAKARPYIVGCHHLECRPDCGRGTPRPYNSAV